MLQKAGFPDKTRELWSLAEPHRSSEVVVGHCVDQQSRQRTGWQRDAVCGISELLAATARDILNAAVIGGGEARDTRFGPSFAA